MLISLALTPAALSQLPAAPGARPAFEVAAIKPNTSVRGRAVVRPPVGGRFMATKVTLETLIALAYKAKNFEISGGPGWIRSDRYDISAKAEERNPDQEQLLTMLQTLLEDRFKLIVHRETKEMPVYALVPARRGLRLPGATPGSCATFGLDSAPPAPDRHVLAPCDRLSVASTWLEDSKISMPSFASALAGILGRPVIDKTGYTGTFELDIEFAPVGLSGPPVDGGSVDSSEPSIFTVLQELGLKLEAQRAPAEIVVIDHAEKASEN